MSMKLSNLALPSQAQLSNYDDSVELTNSRLETNVVRPTNFTDNGKGQIDFVIPPIGIIHDVMLTFALETPAAQNTLGTYLCGSVGIAGVIDEMYFSIGGSRVCSINSYGDRFSSRRCFRDMSDRETYDSFKYGTSDFYITKIDHAGNQNNGVGYVNSTYKDYVKVGDQTTTPYSSSTFRLNLKDMFEFFNESFDLPAFTLDPDQVIKLHIKLKDEVRYGNRVVVDDATANNPAFANATIERASCKLFVDSVFLDESRMITIQNQYQSGQVIKYGDIETTKTSNNVAAQTSKDLITINGTGKVLKGVTFALKPVLALKPEAYNHTFGDYISYSYDRTGFNIQVNNKNVLNSNSENMLLSESAYLYGTFNFYNDYIDQPLGLLDYQFGDYTGMSDTQINSSVAQDRDQWAGLQKYYGLSLGRGVSVSNVAPTLEIYRDNTTAATNIGNAEIVTFCDVVRYFSIRNGRVNVTY